MHYKLLVTVRAGSSLEARRRAHDLLFSEGFVYDPAARWSGGLADWFVIGGRWSGSLKDGVDWLPERRDPYAQLGYEDDAQRVTPELYDRFLAPYEGAEVDSEYVDLDGEPLSRAFIGTRWVVVIDYHN